jgi:predicted  nucleic acid-binding Zn ribbon protein
MGSQLVFSGKTKKVEYRIYNIDNVYTVYIKITTQPNSGETVVSEPVYSAIKSFPTLKQAKDYATEL